jgi:lipid II:glycine glycyltransferase (peptidoglycan interpeptide bridge formation enzyme)
MKYSFEIVNKIDRNTWDTFIEQYPPTTKGTPRTTFIQSSLWDEIHKNLNIPTIPLLIKNDKKQIVGLGLGIKIYAKRGKYLYFRNGPLINWQNADLVKDTIKFLKKLAKKDNMWFIRISPLIEPNSKAEKIYSDIKAFNTPISSLEGLDTWVSDIHNHTEETLLKSFKKKTRYEVKKALKNCEFEVYDDTSKFEDFFYILTATAKRNGWKPFPENFIKEELKVFSKYKKASLILAKHNQKYIAGAIFVHYANQTSYHHSGSLKEYKHLSAPYGIIWHAYKEALKQKSTHLNFWGLAPINSKANHPWAGLTQFKKKFPGEQIQWLPAKDIVVTPKYLFTHIYDKIEKVKKGY